MDLIDKIFFTSALTMLVSLLLVKIIDENGGTNTVVGSVFLLSTGTLIVTLFIKIWA